MLQKIYINFFGKCVGIDSGVQTQKNPNENCEFA